MSTRCRLHSEITRGTFIPEEQDEKVVEGDVNLRDGVQSFNVLVVYLTPHKGSKSTKSPTPKVFLGKTSFVRHWKSEQV